MGADEKLNVTYSDIGALDMQKQELHEVVKLLLMHTRLYEQIGIDYPRDVFFSKLSMYM